MINEKRFLEEIEKLQESNEYKEIFVWKTDLNEMDEREIGKFFCYICKIEIKIDFMIGIKFNAIKTIIYHLCNNPKCLDLLLKEINDVGFQSREKLINNFNDLKLYKPKLFNENFQQNLDIITLFNSDKNFISKNISVIFSNIESHIIFLINKYEVAFGCIAWLTNLNILNALSNIKGSSIIVQKEDFLRPDINFKNLKFWKNNLRKAYDAIPIIERHFIGLGELSYCNGGQNEAIRCFGYANQKQTTPKMHHKFLLLGNYNNYGISVKDIKCIITGSYNFTNNSELSMENIIIIKNKNIIEKYFTEFLRILSLSEALDWESEYVEPEWRIGS